MGWKMKRKTQRRFTEKLMNYTGGLRFWRWVFLCALGELLGFASAGGMAWLVNTWAPNPQRLALKFLVWGGMLVGGAMEGFLLGRFQWQGLHARFPRLPLRAWVGTTVAVAMGGWGLGMIPSLFMFDDVASGNAAEASTGPGPLLTLLLSMGMGLVLGGIFGGAQWLVLRHYMYKAGYWVLGNALGWGVGMVFLFWCASLPAQNASMGTLMAFGAAGGVAAGVCVGIGTGWFLFKMPPKETAAGGEPAADIA